MPSSIFSFYILGVYTKAVPVSCNIIRVGKILTRMRHCIFQGLNLLVLGIMNQRAFWSVSPLRIDGLGWIVHRARAILEIPFVRMIMDE